MVVCSRLEAGLANDKLVVYFFAKFVKSLRYLEVTFNKIEDLSLDPEVLSESQFELWDAFAVRFARSSDILLTKLVLAIVKADDPAFDGGFRDRLHRAEKLGVLQDVPFWLEVRQLRNVTVHEYSDEDLKAIFAKLKTIAPTLFKLEKSLARFAEDL